MKLYIDYGGTNFRYQIEEGEIFSISSKELDFKSFLDRIVKKYDIKQIGISFAGQVKNGVILSAPNISLKNFPIKEYMKKRYNIDVEIENDLTCASLAENSIRNSKILAILYIGTGFGSGIIIDDKPLIGVNYLGAEIGHIPFKKTPFICGCGRDDCIELSCSGEALKRWSRYYNLSSTKLNDLKRETSSESKKIYKNFFLALSQAFHTIINLFDPDRIVLGGSLTLNNREILNFLQNEIQNSSFKNLRKNLKIELSTFKNGSLEGAKILLKK